MNASTIAKGLLAATLLIGAPAEAVAMSHAAATLYTAQIEQVALGCGVGRTRDAKGRCRHRFNLFDHHDRRHFHRFRQKHCSMVSTPNGRVRRCRV